MRTSSAFPWMIISTALMLVALNAPSHAMAASQDIHVVPNKVHISALFRKATVSVSGNIPKNACATVELDGPAQDAHLVRKGRRGGLWMTVGEMTVHGAPSVYMWLSSPNSAACENPPTSAGYESLKKSIEFKGDLPKQSVATVFDQFVKLKEAQGLYGVFPKGLKVVESGDHASVEGHFTLPESIVPGHYRVVLSATNNGKIVERESADLFVDMTGIPALLRTLAFHHAVWYGLAAVIIAILTGYIMGLLFTSKSAH